MVGVWWAGAVCEFGVVWVSDAGGVCGSDGEFFLGGELELGGGLMGLCRFIIIMERRRMCRGLRGG